MLLQESPIHQDSVILIAQATTTLTEFCQGNRDNQRNAFDSRIFDCLNIMLRVEYGDLDVYDRSGKKQPKEKTRKVGGRAKEMEALFAKWCDGPFLTKIGMEELCRNTTEKEYTMDGLSNTKWREICQILGADKDNGLTEVEFKKWCNSKFPSGAVFKMDGTTATYDENVVQMHLCAADLLGRMLETNDAETRYLAEQVDGMIELPAIVRLFREYSTLGGMMMDGITEKNDIEMNLPSGKVKASEVAFSLYNVFVRLEAFTQKEYHRDTHLLAVDEEFKATHNGDMGTKDFTTAYEEMDKNTAIIEVMVDKRIEQIHFQVQKHWRIDHPSRESVLWSVERGAVTEQVADYMVKGTEIAANMKHSDAYRENPIYAFLIESNSYLDTWFMYWTYIINLAMIITWVAPRDGSAVPVISVPFTSPGDVMDSNDTAAKVMQLFGWIHVVLTGLMLCSFFLTHPPSLWHSKMQDPDAPKTSKEAQAAKLKKAKENKNVDIIRKLRGANFIDEKLNMKYLPIFSSTSLYYFFLMACSVLGVVYHGYTFALCMLHVIHGNDILSRVLQAVTQNGISLLYVALLLAIFIYIYALIGFGYYREFYESNFCYSMVQCLFTSLRLGLLMGGGLGEAFDPDMSAGRILFDISFFLLITIIGLNIVFGIIVDTFSELREDKNNTEAKMRDECFICGLSAISFDRFGAGWKHHILKEHHMWDYLYLLRHFDEKDATEFTYLEQYVAEKIVKEETDFYPFGRALAIPPGVPGGDPVGNQSGKSGAVRGDADQVTLEKVMAYLARLEAKIDAQDAKAAGVVANAPTNSGKKA